MNKPAATIQLISILSVCTAALSPVIVQAADQKPPAACVSKEYRQFDFWLGNWTVKGGKGKVVGHSQIASIVNGCGLSESWTSASGNHGVSYNFFDNSTGHWHQTWIDVQGSALYLNGNFSDGKMVLTGETTDKKGVKTGQKISWSKLPDGRVKQHWEISKDNGKSWSDAFVGYYSKQPDH